MKQTIIAVVALVILVAGGYYAYQQGSMSQNIDLASSTVETTSTSTGSTMLIDSSYVLNKEASTASWEGSKKIVTNWIDRGSIGFTSGKAEVASSTLTSAEIIFDMKSISASETGSGSGFDQLVKHLKSDDFFAVEKNPTATFKIADVNLNGGKQTIKGDLTVKGITKEVEIDVNLQQEAESFVVYGTAVVDRTLFNVKFGSTKFFQDLGDNVISDEFKLDFKVVLDQAN